MDINQILQQMILNNENEFTFEITIKLKNNKIVIDDNVKKEEIEKLKKEENDFEEQIKELAEMINSNNFNENITEIKTLKEKLQKERLKFANYEDITNFNNKLRYYMDIYFRQLISDRYWKD